MKPGTLAILALLRARPEGVTALEALEQAGSFRLAARVYELRAAGYDVESEPITTPSGKRIDRYRLVEKAPEQLRLDVA